MHTGKTGKWIALSVITVVYIITNSIFKKHLAGDAKMDVFWTIYNTLDEIGRRELIKRLMVRPLKNNSID
ncbi:MAG: hypothetical protein M8353_01025 [ANME-2 cluster archaeon]|nr:hypothetical protein [ANME-2 cluster archaeon]